MNVFRTATFVAAVFSSVIYTGAPAIAQALAANEIEEIRLTAGPREPFLFESSTSLAVLGRPSGFEAGAEFRRICLWNSQNICLAEIWIV